MKNTLLILIFTCIFFYTPLVLKASPECQSGGQTRHDDPACYVATWSKVGETANTCEWKHWYTDYSCVGMYVSSPDQCPPGEGIATHVRHYNTCGGTTCTNSGDLPNVSNSVDVYDWVYTCSRIKSYTYGACIDHDQRPNGAVWETIAGADCKHAPEDNYCNAPPEVPEVDGPENCDKNADCGSFSISKAVKDLDVTIQDKIQYRIKWGDGSEEDFGGLVSSGEKPNSNSITHKWTSFGSKTVQVQACDNQGVANSCSALSAGITVNVLQCGSNNIPNSLLCTDSTNETGLSNYILAYPIMKSGFSVKRILNENCSAGATKCKVKCDNQTRTLCDTGTSYKYNSVGPKCDSCLPNCCEKDTCIGKACDNGCDGMMVNGIKDCRDQNWQEVSPE